MFKENKIFLESYQNDRKVKRQELLEKIEKHLNFDYNVKDFKVMLYTANVNFGAMSAINLTDVLPFQDIIYNLSQDNKNFCLIIHSPGGQLNPVEKILNLIRRKFDRFIIIIPNAAKSAATMLALGSDEIIMNKDSEIGPIDPQIPQVTEKGAILIPANSIINSIEYIKKKIEEGEPYQLYVPILANIKPEWIDIANRHVDTAKEFARKWLSDNMLMDNKELAVKIVKELSEFKVHDKMVSAIEAQKMGLKVKILEDDNELWKTIWELYYRAELEMQQSGFAKLYETTQSSVNQKVEIVKQPQ